MHISAGYKTICVPVASEADYQTLIRNGRTFRCFLDDRIAAHPELFPTEIANGYWLHDNVHDALQRLFAAAQASRYADYFGYKASFRV